MFFIFRFFPSQRADSFVRFLIWSHVTPCFYCQSMITKSQFCHDASVWDVGDLVKVILASVIIYCFDFTVGSYREDYQRGGGGWVGLLQRFAARYCSRVFIG